MATAGRRRAQQVAYSVYMLGDIAGNYDNAVDGDEFSYARCMIDAFYVHLRLMADFLVKGTSGRDFGPQDFGVEWTKPDTPEADRLLEYWDRASKYVVHFGRPRVPEDLGDLAAFQVDGHSFRAMTRDVLAVLSEFLEKLESKATGWSGGARIPDPEADADGWRLRILADQAATLRGAFAAAADGLERS